METKNKFLKRVAISSFSWSKWLLFIALTAFTFLKICLFEWYAYGGLLFSSLWKNPIAFWAFYIPKICAALFIGSSVFLFRKKWWTVVISFIVDLWIFANVIYFRSRNEALLIDVYAFGLLGDLKGFESSILMYIDWKSLSFFIVSLLYAFVVYLVKQPERSFSIFGIVIFFILMLDFIGTECLRLQYARDPNIRDINQKHYYNSLSPSIRAALFQHSTTRSVSSFSIVHLLGWDIVDAFSVGNNKVDLSEQDKLFVNQHLINNESFTPIKRPLIIIVFESLENWAVNEICTPNIMEFMKSHHYLRATQVVPQVRDAHSMDGQMIINTGLLPLIHGAVPYLFPSNSYPSICDLVDGEKVTIVPHGIDVYNQDYMSKACGYDTTLSSETDDYALVKKGLDCLNQGYSVLQLITIASHSPFIDGAQKSALKLDEECPDVVSRYMKAVHYTDECLGRLFKKINEDKRLHDAVVVITGDHNALYSDARSLLIKYVHDKKLGFQTDNPNCPLIIFSSSFDENIVIDDEMIFQMDIFPTIVNALQGDTYFWKGLGVNLLDSSFRKNRAISSEEALILSDKLIKSDFFNNYLDR